MKQKTPHKEQNLSTSWMKALLSLLWATLVLIIGLVVFTTFETTLLGWWQTSPKIIEPSLVVYTDSEKIENGIHAATGLKYAKGFDVVRASCTTCHSAQLITQNRATREGWQEMIRWMQKTQGLWELGQQEPIILDYLATHYAPKAVGRRVALEDVEWYLLENDKSEK